MPGTLLHPRIQNVYHLRHKYGAGWRSPSFRRTSDMADFGPDVTAVDPRADNPVPTGAPKPVNYLPVPRRGGKDVLPALTLGIGLSEEGNIRAVRVPAWDGAKVQIEVWNVWDPAAPKKVELEGTLHGLVCKVEVSAETLRGWLDFTKPLGAGVNENLLDFRFRIPRIVENGSVFGGESQNRLFLYRRKVLVFFPGVFGSQVQFTTPDGQKIGFPDLSADDKPPARPAVFVTPHQAQGEALARAADTAIRLTMPVGKLGALECDDAGKPLMESNPPTLLMVKGQIYDPFDRLHGAARKRFAPVPEGFLLNRIFVSPYDWRGNILETVRKKIEDLKRICDGEFGRRAPDSDDQVALIGHSTGGLVARGMLASKEVDALVSHAFFQNVPFRGAAKTLSVMATGRDPLDGKSMIPIIDPHSLRAVALTSPIVYLLSANQKYKQPVFIRTRGGVPERMYGLEAERAWVSLAIATGFMPSKKAIPAGAPLSPDQRRAIALRADEWNAYWDEWCERRRGRTLVEWMYSEAPSDAWPRRELARRSLVEQDALRVEEGWNEALARAADEFHERCEEWARTSPGVDRCFIFYSVAEDPTTVRTDATLVEQQELPMKEFLDVVGVSMAETRGQVVHPPIKQTDVSGKPLTPAELSGDEPVEEGVWLVERWYPAKGTPYGHRLFGRQVWRFATRRQIAGDGTVPLASQIGFGGKAKVFKRIVDKDGTGPDHVSASNHPWVWDRIVETLQGHDMTTHLAGPKEVDPFEGIDHDEHKELEALRKEYALHAAKHRA